jgi:hypothetical protein
MSKLSAIAVAEIAVMVRMGYPTSPVRHANSPHRTIGRRLRRRLMLAKTNHGNKH